MLSARELRHLADYIEMNPVRNAWGTGTEDSPYCPASFVALDRNMRKAGFEHWFSANPRAMAVACPIQPSITGADQIFNWIAKEYPLFIGGPASIFSYPTDLKREEAHTTMNREQFAKRLRADATRLEKAELEGMVKPSQVTTSEDQYMVTGIDKTIEWELTTVTS